MATGPQAQTRLLLIDDDERLGEMISTFLTDLGMTVEHRLDAQSGMQAAASGNFDAVILDIMLPGMDGFEACRRLRALSNIPILMLSARREEMDRIVGLEIGADDYLPKPFNPRELAARIRAILRRSHRTETHHEPLLRFGPLVIDKGAREARKEGRLLDLTSHQFSLLCVLAERAGRVQSREQLMEAVRGTELEAFDRSIDVHISRIRAEIEDDPKEPKYIRTIRAAGYVFTAPRER